MLGGTPDTTSEPMRQLLASMIVLLIILSAATPANARRGGSDFMNSPGYQRALIESRKAYRQQIEQQRAYEQYRARKPRKRLHHR